ncbi:hypothetical protein ACH4S8_45060, partial [Streptomyces sp. NPDC021080]
MGVYLVSVGAEEWFDDEEDGWGEVASALNAELRRRGLPPYEDVPLETDFVPGSGQAFEEKLSPSMTGFLALCQTHLSQEESEIGSGAGSGDRFGHAAWRAGAIMTVSNSTGVSR